MADEVKPSDPASSDGRFYAVLVAVVGFVVLLLLGLLLWLQPAHLDVEMIKILAGFAGSWIFAPLIVVLNSNLNRKQVQQGQEQVKKEVIETIPVKVAEKTVEVATKLAEEKTAGS